VNDAWYLQKVSSGGYEMLICLDKYIYSEREREYILERNVLKIYMQLRIEIVNSLSWWFMGVFITLKPCHFVE